MISSRQAMESKLLCGDMNIVDHTREQQRALEQKRKEIADQKVSFKCSIDGFLKVLSTI